MDIDVPEVSSRVAPVVMTAKISQKTIVEYREHNGLLFRSTDIGPDKLAEVMNSRRIFDTKGEIVGSLAHRAMRDYFKVAFRNRNVLPRNLGMSRNEFVMYPANVQETFDMGQGFAVDESDLERAESYREQARERIAGFLAIDGVICYTTSQPVYSATKGVKGQPGQVAIATRGYEFQSDDPTYAERYDIWSRADTTFFSSLSRREAAAHAGVSIETLPEIEVFDPSVVRLDFEALAIERLARNLVALLPTCYRHFEADKITELANYHGSLVDNLGEDFSDASRCDHVADLLSGISRSIGYLSESEAAARMGGFTPDIIDAVIDRWHGRSFDFLPIAQPKLG